MGCAGSVIIDEVYIASAFILKTKSDAPVPRNADGPVSFAISFQGVQFKPGNIHVRRSGRRVQTRQNPFDFVHLIGRYPAQVIGFIQALQSLVTKTDIFLWRIVSIYSVKLPGYAPWRGP